jgi:hypothetical protein
MMTNTDPIENWNDPRCYQGVSSSCFLYDTCRVILTYVKPAKVLSDIFLSVQCQFTLSFVDDQLIY